MNQKSKKFSSFSHVVKFISGILSWTILVILVIIASFLLYYFVSTKIYAKKGEEFKPAFSLYTILSPSMVPNIKVYDVIFDINVNHPEDIKVGDVITFSSTASLTAGMTITHRVVDVRKDENGYSYLTKGDANLTPDGAYVPFKNVYGKVLFKIPQLGRLQEFLGTKGGWLIVVVIPALLVIISDILKIFRLKSVKNDVDQYQLKEKQSQHKEKAQKEKIEKQLTRRYTSSRSIDEEDPIPRKRFVIIDLSKKKVSFELPKKINTPKLAEPSGTKEKNVKNKSTSKNKKKTKRKK